jgi:MATE family multidrug resistance protein
MLFVLGRTDWEHEAQRAKELTNALVLVANVDDSLEVEEKKPPKAEIKEDSLHLFGDRQLDNLYKPLPV